MHYLKQNTNWTVKCYGVKADIIYRKIRECRSWNPFTPSYKMGVIAECS